MQRYTRFPCLIDFFQIITNLKGNMIPSILLRTVPFRPVLSTKMEATPGKLGSGAWRHPYSPLLCRNSSRVLLHLCHHQPYPRLLDSKLALSVRQRRRKTLPHPTSHSPEIRMTCLTGQAEVGFGVSTVTNQACFPGQPIFVSHKNDRIELTLPYHTPPHVWILDCFNFGYDLDSW